MSKAQTAEPTSEEIVAAALNEQGYLFHHKVADILSSGARAMPHQHHWRIEASELPVSLPNGEETRIDLVLSNEPDPQPRYAGGPGHHRQWRVIMECKRAARDYKRWVFFGRTEWPGGPSPSRLYVEKANLAGTWDQRAEPPMSHSIEPRPASSGCPLFDYGVEARLNRPGSGQRASATTAIEDAFQQVTLGQAGLALKLLAAHQLYFHLLPVVVTTADLMSAQFSVEQVSQAGGMIDPQHIRLQPEQWLAVNFRVNDSACQFAGIGARHTADLATHLVTRQVRTVFVVQAEQVQSFLAWLEKSVVCAQQ